MTTDQTTQLYLDEVREIHQDWETGRLSCPQPDGPCLKCQTRADDAAKCIPGLLDALATAHAEIGRLHELRRAAAVWRWMRAGIPTTPKPESAALIEAVDKLTEGSGR